MILWLGWFFINTTYTLISKDPCVIAGRVKWLDPIVNCTKEEIRINDWTGLILHVAYWEWQDCPSWCFHAHWNWIYYNWKILDQITWSESSLYEIFDKKYSDYNCFFPQNWVYAGIKPTNRYLLSNHEGDWYSTILEYNSNNNKDTITNLIKEDFSFKARGNFNYCTMNWKAHISTDWKNIDISSLEVQKYKIEWINIENTEELINKCSEFYAHRSDCLAKIALQKNEPNLCKEIDETQWGTNYYRCIKDIVWKYHNSELCSQFSWVYHEICQETYKNSLKE